MNFVDANVLLEVIQRRSRVETCERFLGGKGDKAISILTLDLVMYFAERDKLEWSLIESFLESFTWLPIVDADIRWAFMHFNGKDFEDALQVACALREGCNMFVTLDRALAKKYDGTMPIELLGW